RDPVPRLVEAEVLRRPHLMLADARGDDRVVEPAALAQNLVQTLNCVLRQDRVVAIVKCERLLLAPLVDSLEPTRVASAPPPPATRSALAVSFSIALRSVIASRTSAKIATSAYLFLFSSDGSMSMCTMRPCLANSLSLPVTRSSKRTPKASSRSASLMARLAYTLPCMPSMCRQR